MLKLSKHILDGRVITRTRTLIVTGLVMLAIFFTSVSLEHILHTDLFYFPNFLNFHNQHFTSNKVTYGHCHFVIQCTQ